MSTEKKRKRGGSDTAREKGLTGVVVHFTPEARRLVGLAAAMRGLKVKEFVRLATEEVAQRVAGHVREKPEQSE